MSDMSINDQACTEKPHVITKNRILLLSPLARSGLLLVLREKPDSKSWLYTCIALRNLRQYCEIGCSWFGKTHFFNSLYLNMFLNQLKGQMLVMKSIVSLKFLYKRPLPTLSHSHTPFQHRFLHMWHVKTVYTTYTIID